MPFCPACGASAIGPFCPKCRTPTTVPGGAAIAAAPAANAGLTENAVGARALLRGRCDHRDHLPGDCALRPESANQVPCLPIDPIQPGVDASVVRHDPSAPVSAAWTLPAAQPVQ